MSDVVVIGAGASGLAAAGALVRRGLAVTVLEARPRIGGRIHTLHDDTLGVPIELGAEFVHDWPDELTGIIDAAGLPAIEITGEHWRASGGKVETVEGFWKQIANVLAHADAQREPDRSFAEMLEAVAREVDPESARLALDFVEGFNAADAHRVSERSIAQSGAPAEKGEKPRLGRVVAGYDHVVHWLARDLPRDAIRLRTIVTRVEWRAGAATVHVISAAGEPLPSIETRAVLVTVPLGVLAAPAGEPGAIAFEPEVPTVRSLRSRLAMGPVVRITFAFRERFWERGTIRVPRGGDPHALSFIHMDDAHLPVWWTPFPLRAATLVGWTGGPRAARLASRSSDELAHLALDDLAHHVGLDRRELDDLVRGWWHHDWVHDPFARGAYSYTLVGGAEASERPAPPAEATVFFAGEATAPSGRLGTVDGAIASGERAAKEIAEEIAGAVVSAPGVGSPR